MSCHRLFDDTTKSCDGQDCRAIISLGRELIVMCNVVHAWDCAVHIHESCCHQGADLGICPCMQMASQLERLQAAEPEACAYWDPATGEIGRCGFRGNPLHTWSSRASDEQGARGAEATFKRAGSEWLQTFD